LAYLRIIPSIKSM